MFLGIIGLKITKKVVVIYEKMVKTAVTRVFALPVACMSESV